MTMNRVDALMRHTARHHSDPEPAMHVIRASLLFACIRGLAKRALGDAKGADADIAKGLALDPKVAERYAGYGVK